MRGESFNNRDTLTKTKTVEGRLKEGGDLMSDVPSLGGRESALFRIKLQLLPRAGREEAERRAGIDKFLQVGQRS